MQAGLPFILAEALEAIERGVMTPEECLERYASEGDELAGLLAVIAEVQRVPPPIPDPDFRAAARSRLIDSLLAQAPVAVQATTRCARR